MASLKRFCPVGIAQPVIQRGNNRQVCFNGDERYTNLEGARRDLALPPEWKQGNLVVREYTVNAGVNIPTRSGIAGPQKSTNGTTYQGGAVQYEFVIDNTRANWERSLTRTNTVEIK